MSSIKIQKISITDLAVDAIVNAANEGLWAGGGVCGAIFRAAGHSQLQAACDRIGHCDTGSAVITPGFKLKAKYIIHAVGPVWRGGKSGEPDLLYGAYASSLKRAAENNCSSIGFPLISAGIFGYPTEQAWRVAIKACRDFIEAGNSIDIIFAVLSDDILEMGRKILQESENCAKTAAGFAENDSAAGQIIGFHLITEPYSSFSNWAFSVFMYAGVRYTCAEQYMMAQKVSLGQRYDLQQKIMVAINPAEIKELGGREHFPEFASIKSVWDKNCRHIVKRGVKAKFAQNPEMLEELLDTGNALLAECAANDRIWGIGIDLNDLSWKNVANWNGSNYLGQILMEVREELRQEVSEKGAAQYIDYRDAEPIPEWRMTSLQLKRIPQYYAGIHAYADQLPVGHFRDAFYGTSLEQVEKQIRSGGDGVFPASGFFEMKQEVYETARRLRGGIYLSEICRDEPKQWGLRGDPYFWRTLATRFAFKDISITEGQLRDKIYQIFKEKTGQDLTEESQCFVKEYAYGGMSSGRVDGGWWINTGIPRLVGRLRELKG